MTKDIKDWQFSGELPIFSPPRDIDLSQAVSTYDTAGFAPLNLDLNTGARRDPKAEAIEKFRQVLESSMSQLTESTSKVLDKQAEVLEAALRTTQEALNEMAAHITALEERLNYQSRELGNTQDALDAFIKVFMLAGNEQIDITDQQKIMAEFLKRGLPVSQISGLPVSQMDEQVLEEPANNGG